MLSFAILQKLNGAGSIPRRAEASSRTAILGPASPMRAETPPSSRTWRETTMSEPVERAQRREATFTVVPK